ncbi:MAG: ISAzo13 family transposase [Chloroflexi bacterium]|nr:ISAzo13 family transposase [Chloroflexota bacterium]
MDERVLAEKLSAILPCLNERQRRLVLAAEARALGHGGVTLVANAAKVSRPTIHQGMKDLASGTAGDRTSVRVRHRGGGRKRLCEKDPYLLTSLEALVDPDTRGDPQSPLRWTCKSVRELADALSSQGHPVSYQVVSELLRQAGYSLQANAKRLEGAAHPDRDAQFRYLNEQVKAFLTGGDPVVSVDAKKKELVGRYKNPGREWQPQGAPEEVNVYDFLSQAEGRAIPYGIYEVGRNVGWVSVGRDHDTATFAVESLRRWWAAMGCSVYPQASRLLVSADGGGSNGYRVRLWKVEIQRLAEETGLAITVCHLPPGTSKWNKIEHRLFSHISMNWRGRPLVSHEVIVQLISATTTREGLQVHAQVDTGEYPTNLKVTDEQMAALRLRPHAFHGEWNYTILPQ